MSGRADDDRLHKGGATLEAYNGVRFVDVLCHGL
jgi:hypothetical protein